jgi:cytochrome c-type biogenesis protein CcmH
MVAFILLAVVLATAAVLVVAVPLVKGRAVTAQPAPKAAIGAALVILIGAAAGYIAWGNWTWSAAAAGNLPQNMVARLARHLEHNPADVQGWLMLGHSYVVLQQLPLAARAFERADRLSGGRNADALVGLAEALALGDPAELDGRAGRLIERALVLEPNSGKALFYGAAAALRRGALPLARERFVHLFALDPPANVRPILEQQIASIDHELAAQPGPPSAAAAPAPAAASAASDAARVRLNVVLAPAIGARAGDVAPLFVIVRDPRRPGPPLAVKRLESRFPQRVDLTPADSMLPERRFAVGDTVQIIARIARSGEATGAPGDPFGEISYLVGRDGRINVVIDRLTP